MVVAASVIFCPAFMMIYPILYRKIKEALVIERLCGLLPDTYHC